MARVTPTSTDPLGWGMVITIDPRSANGAAAWPGANRGIFMRTINGGIISSVGIEVGVASGNISVAAYASSGAGRAGVPSGAPLASSGSVACPASGYAAVSLGSTVSIAPGDWLFLSCDNTTAQFARVGLTSTGFNDGTAKRQDSAHPAPTVGSLAATSYLPVLIGVA